ncbi:MAG: TolC family protein [Phycisphaerales bacterium]
MPRTPAITIALLAGLAGCQSPLARSDSDRGRQTPAERLRRIEPLPIDRYARPPSTEPAADAEAARHRLESLPTRSVTLAEARASALANNLDIQVALIDPAIAASTLDAEEARFEAAFTTRALWQELDSPTSSSLSSAQSKTQLIEPGVRIPLRTGGTATIGLPVTRSETDNQFSTLNPAWTSDLEFSISHPLLRDAGRTAATTSIRVASYNEQIAQAQTKLGIINQLSAADRAYWRLYQGRKDLDVRQQQYELASAQLERAKRRVAAGAIGEIEVVRAQSGLADRLEAIIVAQNAMLRRQREFKRVINMPEMEVDSTTAVVTATEPAPVEYLIDTAAVTNDAVQSRMELLEIELRLLADAANIELDRNRLLPQLNLDATYRINGLGSSSQDSFRTLGRNKFEDWSVGATLEVPLGNEAAKSQLRGSLLRRLQRLGTREARVQTVRQEVLDAIDAIDSGWQRILASRQATILATRALAAEQRQFDVGGSTSTNVLDAATRLAESQLSEIQALTDYQIAQTDLAEATGTLLGAAHVQWSPTELDASQKP